MVQDLITSVREAEQAAERKIADAERQKAAMIEKAHADAEALLHDCAAKIEANRADLLQKAKAEGDRLSVEAIAQADTQIGELKAKAAKREKEAIALVLSELT